MNKLKKNILYNLSYQLLILLVPMITSPYLSRVLGPAGIGTYSYVHSAAYYFFILVTLGLNNYGNRLIAKADNHAGARSKVFFSVYFLQLLCGVLALCAYSIYILGFADRVYRTYFIIYLPYVLSAVLDINWFFFGIGDFRFTTIRSAAVKLLTLLSIFIFVKESSDLTKYFLIMGISHLLSNLLLWTRLFRYVHFYKPKFEEAICHLKPNLLLFIPIFAISVYRVMDKIMIKEFSNIVQNAYYENADKIITMALTGFSAAATVMMPFVSGRVAKGDTAAVKALFRDTMQISMCFAVGCVFGLLAVAKEFAVLFFGQDFAETGIILQMLSGTVFLSGWKAVLRSQYIIPYEKDRAYVISLVAGAVMNVLLNIIFIPIYQARGAVLGTLAAEFIGFLIQTYVVSKEFKISTMFKDTASFLPAGILMYLAVRFLTRIFPHNMVCLIFTCCIGVLVYSALNLVFGFMFSAKRTQYLFRTYLFCNKK